VNTLNTAHLPYPDNIRSLLTTFMNNEGTPSDISRANSLLGHLNADAVEAVLKQSNVETNNVSVVGYHGQTVQHLPCPAPFHGHEISATLQLGDSTVIAERLGITVVSNFRARDIAAGGQGAPLVPLFDYEIFSHRSIGRAVLNIGGIANITLLPAGVQQDSVVAYDSGPGNSLLDLLALRMSEGKQQYDDGGLIAGNGVIHGDVLEQLLEHPYFSRKPPKSTGREEFGTKYLDGIRKTSRISDTDLMATLVECTAESIALSIREYWPDRNGPEEVIASGGGVRNNSLLVRLKNTLHPALLRTSDEFGIDPDFKEAIAFAFLADRTMQGLHGNLPSATGAQREVILGDISPA
jgi:anhydro-N-acetylmuramic acid kinase